MDSSKTQSKTEVDVDGKSLNNCKDFLSIDACDLNTKNKREEFIPGVAEQEAESSSQSLDFTFKLPSVTGEPAKSQRLQIDFTPIDGVGDSDYVVRKCQDFWKLIQRNPDLQRFKILSNSTSGTKTEITSKSRSEQIESTPTAVDWLTNKENVMSEGLATKFSQRFCADGSEEYFIQMPKVNDAVKAAPASLTGASKSPMMSQRPTMLSHRHRTNSSSRTRKTLGMVQPQASSEAAELCKQLESWDLDHPKSMEPPGHPPALSHATMQAKLY